jgi:hypothetical protein
VTSFAVETPWKPADEDDGALVQALADAVGADVEDPRLRVRGVGHDARLRAGQTDRPMPEVVDRHRAQRARHPLAGRQEHVHLARVGLGRDLEGVGDEPVGLLAAGRQDGDDVVPLLALGDDAGGRPLEALGVRDRRAAELHDHGAGHGRGV